MKNMLRSGGSRASRRAVGQNGHQANRPLIDAPLVRQPSFIELAEAVLDRAERRFAARADGSLLERYALEAAMDLLSTPQPRVNAYLPELGLRKVHEALEQDAA